MTSLLIILISIKVLRPPIAEIEAAVPDIWHWVIRGDNVLAEHAGCGAFSLLRELPS